ncbi:MAG TPA: hypothetical protein VJB69_03395, partial [Candidatus Paceibacterota bacterium]
MKKNNFGASPLVALLAVVVFAFSLFLGVYGSQSFINQQQLVAGPGVLTSTSFFDDYDNLSYVDQSSFNNVNWDSQSAIAYAGSIPPPPLSLTNLKTTTGRTLTSGSLNVNQPLYIDRGYTFTTVPATYQNKIYIKTANEDKGTPDANYLS